MPRKGPWVQSPLPAPSKDVNNNRYRKEGYLNGGSKVNRKGINFKHLKVVGRTTDGRLVIGGWFPLVNSEGISLDMVLSFFESNNLIPSWPSFIDQAIEYNWNMSSLRTKLEASVGDVYGQEYRNQVIEKFDIYLKNRYGTLE